LFFDLVVFTFDEEWHGVFVEFEHVSLSSSLFSKTFQKIGFQLDDRNDILNAMGNTDSIFFLGFYQRNVFMGF
jgi:hypothetical protein